MGVYDRDYYREPAGGWWAGRANRSVTAWLIGLNAVAFVGQLLTHQELTRAGWFDLADVLRGEVWRVLTAHFLHGGLMHLAFNMLVLYWAGTELEALYGPAEFLAFYLAAALVVSAGSVALGLAGVTAAGARWLGASGPVMAAFVLLACRYPYQRVLVMFVLPLPLWAAAVGYVAVDALGFAGVGQRGIAYAAHLLGAAFAVAYYWFGLRVTRLLPLPGRWAATRRAGRRPGGATPPPRARPAAPPDPAGDGGPVILPFDEHLEAKLDRVLEKLNRSGPDSLTDEERTVLAAASETYKKRRR